MADPELFKAVAFNPLRLPQQTALGAGFGLRYDFDFFIARADWGLQVYDPRRLYTGEAWWTPDPGAEAQRPSNCHRTALLTKLFWGKVANRVGGKVIFLLGLHFISFN